MLKFAGLLVVAAGLSSASTLTYFTSSPTEAGGNAISGEVDFTTSAGQLTITLKNLQSGATTVAQNISDLEFVLSSGLLGAGTGMTSFGEEIICSGASCTPQGGTDPTGWGLGTDGTENIICIVCPASTVFTIAKSGTPSHTILGPNAVDAGSIDTGSHNPFINQTATFVITSSSITADTTVGGVVFSFGTAAGDNVTGCASRNCGGTTQSTPEPYSMFLMGGGFLGIGLINKFRRS